MVERVRGVGPGAPSSTSVGGADPEPGAGGAPAGGGRPRWGVAAAVDVAVIVGALALALTPLLPVYGHRSALPAIAGGLALGAAVAVAGAWRRWSAMTVVAVLLVTYALAGGALAAPTTTTGGLLPGRGTLAALARGAASAWKQALTLQPPIGSGGTVLVAALLLALVGSAAAVTVTLRLRRPQVAALAAGVPVLVALGAALLGTRTPPVPPAVLGTALAVVLGGWAAWRAGRLRASRVLATGLIAAVAIGSGLTVGPGLVADHPRFVLRDRITPPFDPDDYPSPLAAFRAYVKLDETVLFTVTGLPEGARIRLATLDRYDGVVWNVAGSGAAEASGEFRRVGDQLTATVAGTSARVQVQVGALTGPWLPTVGEATHIGVDDAAAAAGLRYNDATDAAVLVGGLRPGLRYTLDAVVPAAVSVEELGGSPAAAVSSPTLTGQPARVRTLAPEVAREAGKPAEVVQALATWLTDHGYFSHGQSGEHPSLSGHGADRLARFLGDDVMVGDGEQYAATLALMVREMGLPARVVLGFAPQSGAEPGSAGGEPASAGTPIEVTGADIRAWVEVPFAGHGWVAFDATPPESKTVDEDPDPQPSEPKPQVVQPPPPADASVSPPDDDTARPNTRQDDEQAAGGVSWQAVLLRAGIGAGVLVLLVGPLLLVAALKLARRRRRRRASDPVHRVAGGWDEVMDAARDLGRAPGLRLTRREAAGVVGHAFAAGSPLVAVRLAGLAHRADRAVFARGEPSDADVAAYWADVDATLAEMRGAVPARTRLHARASTASLRGRVAGPVRQRSKVPNVRSTLLLRRRGGAL